MKLRDVALAGLMGAIGLVLVLARLGAPRWIQDAAVLFAFVCAVPTIFEAFRDIIRLIRLRDD